MSARWVACSSLLVACGVSPSVVAPTPPEVADVVRVELVDGPGIAPLVAFQDGDGPWRTVACRGGCELRVTRARFGVVGACRTGAPSVALYHATAGELPVVPMRRCASEAVASIHGRVSGVEGEGNVVTADGVSQVFGEGTYVVEVPRGTIDLVAVDRVRDRSGDHVRRFAIVRELQADGERALDVDLATDGVSTGPETITVEGGSPGETVRVFAVLETRGGADVLLTSTWGPQAVVDLPPASSLSAADRLYVLGGIDSPRERRGALTTGRRLVLGPPLGEVEIAVTDTAQVRVRAAWPRHPDGRWYKVEAVQRHGAADTENVMWSATVSRGWLGDHEQLAYTFPEIDVAEWPDAVELWPGYTIAWSVTAATRMTSVEPRWDPAFEARTATRKGTITP